MSDEKQKKQKPGLTEGESEMFYRLMRNAPKNLKFIVLGDDVTAINIDLLAKKELPMKKALEMSEEDWRKFFEEDCKPLM